MKAMLSEQSNKWFTGRTAHPERYIMPRNLVWFENKCLFEFLFMAAEYFENILNAISLLPVFCEMCVTAFYFAYMVLLRFTSITVSRNCYKNVKPWRSPTFFLRSIQLHILRYQSIPIFNGSGKPTRLPLINFKWFNSPSAKWTLRKPGTLCPTWM